MNQIKSNVMKKLLIFRNFIFMAMVIFAMNVSLNAQPVVTVLQPNELGVEWVIGNTHLISWTSTFTLGSKIELIDYTNPLLPVTTLIAASAPGSTYAWSINPAVFTPGTKYRIKVSSAACGDCYMDVSDNYFKLVTSLTGSYIFVEQPNIPNISWIRGTTNVISWTKNIPGNVKIELTSATPYVFDKAADNASFPGYAGGAWGHGTNGGYGFLPWKVQYTAGTSGIVDNPAGAGIVGMDNPSFHIEAGPGAHIYTDRPFSSPLIVGESFRFDWAVNADNGGSGGTKGIKIYSNYTDIATPGNTIINIEHSNGDEIRINGNPMFSAAGVNKMQLRIDYINATTVRVYGTGRNGVEVFDQNFTVIAPPNAVRFYTENMNNMHVTRRLYFNNLSIKGSKILLATGVSGSTYEWTIASNIPLLNNNYKILITSLVDPNVFDSSDNNFSIVSNAVLSMALYQPNSTSMITWLKESAYLISWNGSSTFPVKIELFKGATFHTLIATGIVGSTHPWTISPAASFANGNDYSIKVTRIIDGVFVQGLPFSILNSPVDAYITVLQPLLGHEWLRGNTHLISWIDNVPEPVNIYYKKGTGPEVLIQANVLGSTYPWAITDLNVPNTGSDYKIVIRSSLTPTIVGMSGTFSILDFSSTGTITVLQPSVSNIKLLKGTSYLISWSSNTTYPVKIELIKGGTNLGVLPGNPGAASVLGSTYIWNIPASTAIGTDYRIRVSRVDAPAISGVSANDFEITNSLGGTITVLQPNGGEYWYINNSYLISWEDNLLENVNIDLFEADGITLKYSIATNVAGSTYIWNTTGHLPVLGGQYLVKISSSIVPSIFDFSNAPFNLLCLPLANAYPNPARDVLNLKFDDSAKGNYIVQLFDRYNLNVLSRTFNASFDKELQISTAALPNGVYFLSIASDRTKTTQKVIVQH